MTLLAPAKLNLCLYLGERRSDGRHELASLFCPLDLADRLTVSPADRDRVVCPGLAGPNLAEAALAELREAGWSRPPVEVRIDKRIPVAAGLGGGSADAAAVLRLAGDEVPGTQEIAGRLGADVPSQHEPRFSLVRGAGEVVEPLPAPASFGVVLIPADQGLSTAEVYAEADRRGLGRDAGELELIASRLRDAAREGASPIEYGDLLVNDLQSAAASLRPEIGYAIGALQAAGSARALITGSGPTAVGLFATGADAERAVSLLRPRFPSVIVASPREAS